ncbi:amidase [Halomonas garicola]|uniref:amidase n=1 Tax=Halomonas garicola TaxID=1690008 RepID=UPI0028A2DA08|nr:amidase [Halomonas garicola]
MNSATHPSSSPLASALKKLRRRPESLVDVAEQALAARVPAWEGYAAWAPEKVREHARSLVAQARSGKACGPWYGLPVSIKDNIGLAGWPLRAGCAEALPPAWQGDATITARCRRRGALFTGLTRSVPFAFTSIGVTLDDEGPRNPWDTDRVCGGSSSGAAVSVAEGSAWLALGSDTAGSIRVPAAMTGGVGLKLTAGRWPMKGVVPLSHSLDSLGVITASVADLTAALGACGDPMIPKAPRPLAGLKLGVLESAPRVNAEAGIDEALAYALHELEAAGAQCVAIDFPEAREADALFRSGGLVAAELETFLALKLPSWRRQMGPLLAESVAQAGDLTAADYRQRLADFQRLGQKAAMRFHETGIDALVLPTSPLLPPRRDAVARPSAYAEADARILRHTAFVNYLRWCALSLPVGLDNVGLPIGLQLAMPGFAEPQLLAAAAAIERCLGNPRERLGLPPRP